MTNDPTLFAGAAPWYSRYRLPYPDALIADLVEHCRLDGRGRLLDLGCGPGTLTLPLAPHFEHVIAIDPDPGMIAEAERLAAESGVTNIAFEVRRAEDLTPDMGLFRLVSAGSSFHWMNRDLVLARVAQMLEPGCGIALAGGGAGWYDGALDWQIAITDTIKRYLGRVRMAGNEPLDIKIERFQQTLPRNNWSVDFERAYDVEQTWDLDSIVGLLWSTSFSARHHFGDRVDDYERDVRAALLAINPTGLFPDTTDFGLVCGRPPA